MRSVAKSILLVLDDAGVLMRNQYAGQIRLKVIWVISERRRGARQPPFARLAGSDPGQVIGTPPFALTKGKATGQSCLSRRGCTSAISSFILPVCPSAAHRYRPLLSARFAVSSLRKGQAQLDVKLYFLIESPQWAGAFFEPLHTEIQIQGAS